jgi:hypothetical protein
MMTKGELVNGAYEELKISGITSKASNEDIVMGLKRLESMIANLESSAVFVGYVFAESFDTLSPNDDSGLTVVQYDAVTKTLACRLATAFGKMVPPSLSGQAREAVRMLYSVELPTRNSSGYMPTGSGYSSFDNYCGSFAPQDDPITIPGDGTVDDLTT